MAAEGGCFTLTLAEVAAGQYVVTPSATPVYGSAYVEAVKNVGFKRTKVVHTPRSAVVSGNDLIIQLGGGDKPGDHVCWTSYDS